MKIAEALLASVMVCATLATTATAAETPPRWAYIEDNRDYKPPVDNGNLVHVPNSTAGYTWTQLRTQFIAPIWHPGDHAPLPDIVANGRKPDVAACGYFHRADGPGGPENADLAGLPKNYIIRQMADYKSRARSTAVPGRVPPSMMIALSKPITDAEVVRGLRQGLTEPERCAVADAVAGFQNGGLKSGLDTESCKRQLPRPKKLRGVIDFA